MSSSEDLVPMNLKRPQSKNLSSSARSIADYHTLKEIGEGSFSTVYHGREKFGERRDVAIKMCSKKQIVKEKRIDAIMREKNLLAKLSQPENLHPFIVVLFCTTQDVDHLYFVISYAARGDLKSIMEQLPKKHLTDLQSQFYAAELLEALGHIHRHGIIHRDVKPENILVQESGHILLSDFGSAKDLNEKKPVHGDVPVVNGRGRRGSFVGSAPFVTPEMLAGKEVDETCDFWALGVSLFQFLTGELCFHDESEYLIFRRIQKLLFKFPENFPACARSLIENLLILDPCERLGSISRGGITTLQAHAYFENVPWEAITTWQPPPLDEKKNEC